MEVVHLSKEELTRFRDQVSKLELPKQARVELERDSATVDDIEFVVVKPKGSPGTQSEIYSIEMKVEGTRYVFLVQQGKEGILSISLNVIRRSDGERSKAVLTGYSLNDHKIVTVQGVLDYQTKEPRLEEDKVLGIEGLKELLQNFKISG